MAPPRRTSTEGSIRRSEQSSRRSSVASASINVFSDDFAIENVDLPGTTTPSGSIQESEDLTLAPRDNHALEHIRNVPRPGLSAVAPSLNRPSSVAKRPQPADHVSAPHRAVSTLSHSDVTTQRSGSISSRLSIPRPQSPYTGPTAPSQPYAMYPQVTRASSIASESTIRPLENPFLDPHGPEHPYAMYQNAVPEEEDGSESNIPLGFHGTNTNFRGGSRSTGSETGDIVGSDGHIEQLPPYTRYADNVLAKGDMREIRTPAASIREEPSSSAGDSVTLAPSDSAVELTTVGTRDDEEQAARKEGWIAKGNKRRCCGLPLWTMLLICLIIVIAATAGGVIGGLIGNDRGSDKAAALASAASAAAATTTVWLDANPASTNSGTPPCPTGHYIIPLNNTLEVNSCISPYSENVKTWSCMGQADLGMSIFNGGPGGPPAVHFDDYSVRPQLFKYGPQPPDFNGTTFPLSPATDKDDAGLGVALFFSSLFDKLIIIKETDLALPPSPSPTYKRSVQANDILRRIPQTNGGYPMQSEYLKIGDRPWYCFWNSTVEEFWVFLGQDLDNPSSGTQSSSSSMITPAPGSTNTASSVTEIGSAAATSGGGYAGEPSSAATSAAWPRKQRREFPATAASPDFPKLVKMVEKRKPDNNVQPYCQQMQVLNDWQIMPIPLVPTICIEEAPYAQPTSKTRRWTDYLERRNGQTQQQMESNCICEWMTGVEDHPWKS